MKDSASWKRQQGRLRAKRALSRLSYVDVVENPSFESNLRTWLALPFTMTFANKTPPVPPALATPFEREFTDSAKESLTSLSRLDDELWRWVAMRRSPAIDPTVLSEATFDKAIARYTALLG
jgi:hypothetical protein